MLRLSIAVALAAALSSPVCAQNYPSNGYIGVFADAAGTNCCITTVSGSATLHVIAVTGGASSAGITGAEFRIEVSPPAPSAFLVWTASPAANVGIGNPIDNTTSPSDVSGVNLAFASCQKQAGMAGDHIALGTIMVFNLTGQHELLVKKHNRPSNPSLSVPLVTLCDSPNFTKVPLTLLPGDPWLAGAEPTSFRTPINKAGCTGGTCGFVGVEERTWSTLKSLYR